MAFYMDVSVRNYLASYNKRFTKGRKLKRLNFLIYLFEIQDTRYKKLYLKSAFNFNISNIILPTNKVKDCTSLNIHITEAAVV